jgi:hypothetical protein
MIHDTNDHAGSDRRGNIVDPPRSDRTVEPDRVTVWRDSFHILYVSVDGEAFRDVVARRLFPISRKAHYVSFLSDGKEVVMLARPEDLDEMSRRCLKEALDRMYYVARIERIDQINLVMGVSQWRVMTDRGYAIFEITDRGSQVRLLPDGRCLIADEDGNRFEIKDINNLDRESSRLIRTQT